MTGRRRTLFLALLALAAPLPAFGISDHGLEPVTAEPSPAALEVSTSLDSCGVLDDGVVCKLDVSYTAVDGAASYAATVTRADGSVVDYGSVPAGGTSLWVPYVGSGTYSVRVTAYGEPDQQGADGEKGEVIAVGDSRSGGKGEPRVAPKDGGGEQPEGSLDASAGGRDELSVRNADGEPTSEVGSAPSSSTTTTTTAPSTSTSTTTPTTTTTACEPLEPLPPEPPQDLDPDNPDEDQDGIDDEQERAEYEAAVAARDAAAAAGCPTP